MTRTLYRTSSRRSAEPSQEAREAFEGFDELASYFRSHALLARALGWRAATVSAWSRHAVARPRIAHRDAVRRLLALVRIAGEWTTDPHLAGDWTLTRQPVLGDQSPSAVLQVLKDEGLKRMSDNFARVAPRTRVGDAALPSADALRDALNRTLSPDADRFVQRAAVASNHAADLSDFGN